MSKKIFLLAGGMAVQKFGTKLEKEQEALSNLADMMIDIYALESAAGVPASKSNAHPRKSDQHDRDDAGICIRGVPAH